VSTTSALDHFRLAKLHRGVESLLYWITNVFQLSHFCLIVVIVLEVLRSFYTATIVEFSCSQSAHLTSQFSHAVLFTFNSHH
jgi:hypothetical protein